MAITTTFRIGATMGKHTAAGGTPIFFSIEVATRLVLSGTGSRGGKTSRRGWVGGAKIGQRSSSRRGMCGFNLIIRHGTIML